MSATDLREQIEIWMNRNNFVPHVSLLHKPQASATCHSERSEESRYTPNETLRFAQGDSIQRFLQPAHVLVFLAISLCVASCYSQEAKQTVAPPAPKAVKPGEGPADNSGCVVCHMDFDAEAVVVQHAKKKIMCVTCHGPSEPHRIDETLRTKPDILWGRSQVEGLCRQCHKPHKSPAKVEAFRQEWSGKARPNGRFIGEGSICTDCHGEHTIPPKT